MKLTIPLGIYKLLKPEQRIQIGAVQWIREHAGWLIQHTMHIGNERKTTKVGGFIMQLMGVLKGASDLFIAYPSKSYCGLFIEVKTIKGKLSKEQKEFIDSKNLVGYYACVCRSTEEIIETIKAYLNGRL